MIENMWYIFVQYDYLFVVMSVLLTVIWFILNCGNDGIIDLTFIVPLVFLVIMIMAGTVPLHLTPAYNMGHDDYPNDVLYSYIVTTDPDTWDVKVQCYVSGWAAADFQHNPFSFMALDDEYRPALNVSYVHTHLNKTMN